MIPCFILNFHFPQYCRCSLFLVKIWFLFPCSPEVPSFPDPPKPWEDLIYNEIKCVYACAFITGKDHISRYLVTSIQISAMSIALMLLNKFFGWLEYDKINLIELQ